MSARPKTGLDDLYVTDHAVIQFMNRTNARAAKENRLRGIIAFGEEVFPKDNFKKLMNNKFKQARYFQRGGFVAVVVEQRVVTCYRYDPVKFTELLEQ